MQSSFACWVLEEKFSMSNISSSSFRPLHIVKAESEYKHLFMTITNNPKARNQSKKKGNPKMNNIVAFDVIFVIQIVF